MAFVVNAVWKAKPGEEKVVAEALTELIELSRAEPGNLLYQAYRSPDEPLVFRIFEVYETEEAFAAHGESDHFERLARGVAIPVLTERTREFFETFGD